MTLGRRRFVRLSALAVAPLIARPWPAWAQGLTSGGDPVVIVGAGLAGLRAADLLKKAGRSVVILEARAEPGGRVRTIRSPFAQGLFGEAGPVRIAGSHQIVLQLARDFGLSLIPFQSGSGSALVTIGGVSVRTERPTLAKLPLMLRADERGLSQGALLNRYVGELPSDLSDLTPTAASYSRWGDYDRVTWHNWLRARGASEGAITLMTLGGDSRELSALYVLRQFALLRGTTQFYKLEGGMDRLPRAIAASLGDIIRYDAAVVRIDQTDGPPRVDYIERGEAKSLQASHVILAIPLGTLRSIQMRPMLSMQKAQTIETLPYFPATRFLLQSRRRFWHTSGLNGYVRTDQPTELWDATYELPGTSGILGATIGGELGRSTSNMSEERCVRFGMDLARKAFPGVRTDFDRGTAVRWALDPWARGAFAVFYPGQMTTMMPDIGRPEGRVHFAGEHTSAWMGWMEGALESGERAAREVLS